jgi:hypothetical protein
MFILIFTKFSNSTDSSQINPLLTTLLVNLSVEVAIQIDTCVALLTFADHAS